MIIETLIPLYTVVLLGSLLKQWNFLNDAFINESTKILELYLLPGFVFWTIAQPSGQYSGNSDFFIVLIIAGFIAYSLIHLYIILFKVHAPDAALLSQSCYRFNAYICLALAQGFDQIVLKDLCLFIGFSLPVIDILAILTFSRLSQKKHPINEIMRMILNGIILKPLLPACILGVIFSAVNFHWPIFLVKFFELILPATVPFALIVIGGSISFNFLKKPLRLPIIGSAFKFIFLPAIGYFFINLFSLDAFTTKTIMLFLMLPCNITFSMKSSAVLSQISDYNSFSTMLSVIFLILIVIIF